MKIKNEKNTKKKSDSKREFLKTTLSDLKKLKKDLVKKSEEISKRVSEEVKKVNWNKVKKPAIYAAVGFLGGILTALALKRKKPNKNIPEVNKNEKER
ncbi:MAG: hypothetical protein QXD62_03730 [Candidatus Woesearchaeota archaeon]